MTKFSSAPRAALTAVLGCAAILALGVCHIAQASPTLTVSNGEFTSYSGVMPGTSGDYFTSVNPTGWTGGGNLIFVTNNTGIDSGIYLPVYGPTPGVAASPSNPFPAAPLPGNYVEADGNPAYEDSFSYQLSGLTVGQTYQLSFFEAFGQQTSFSGSMSNQWIVGLGVPGSVFNTTPIGSTGFDSYSYSDTTAAANGGVTSTPLVYIPSQSFSPWQQVTVSLTADAPNDVLTFLAWANNGSTVNVPPIAFLDIGANGSMVSTAPEPGTIVIWLLLGGFGLGMSWWRRRKAA